MGGSLARRLTAWYVFVAVVFVVGLAGSLIVAGLLLFAKDANEQIAALAAQIPDIEARAFADHVDWQAAQALLTQRLARPGLVVRTRPPPPRRASSTEPAASPADSRIARPSITRQAGAPVPPPSADGPLFTNRVGFVSASLLGIRWSRRPFLGGSAFIFVDVDRLALIVEVSLGILLATGVLAGLVAWAIGRYITLQAMRPLYDVTSALVRFAGRDFSSAQIAVAGRTEFDALARAYNAAADQVATAFAERAAAEAQMRQFVADAGHELRTPLTIVLGYLDLLKRRAPEDERSTRIFETIAIEGRRMRTLIDNLVLLARLEGEDLRPIEPFELTPLLENDVVATRLAIAPGVQIDLQIGVNATIIGDRDEIYEAVANLVDNAIKYAPGSEIEVEVYPAAAGGVAISVRDYGPGIAPADRELIFDRFHRGSIRTEVSGSGLGLPIARRAVERAGGTLALVESSERGTTFTIVLRADRIEPRLKLAGTPKSYPLS